MTKFVRVQEVPATLTKSDFVISGPDFLHEIQTCSKRRGNSSTIGMNYLRDILDIIGQKYLGPEFNVIRAFNLNAYKGRPIHSDNDVHTIVLDVLEKQQPSILEAYIDQKIRTRPLSAGLIYYTGPRDLSTRFLHWGVDEILQKELEKEQKKTVKVEESLK